MALRFQRQQPGGLEVRGINRHRTISPENSLDFFESGRVNAVQSSVVTGSSRLPMGNSNGIGMVSSVLNDMPPPLVTPPPASPSPESELEARGHEWTTGAMTERSSVSWMDEFDKQTTKTVERMFREIDCALYESNQSHTLSTSETLGQECEDWSSYFPHMRVVGQLLTTPNSSANKSRDAHTPIFMGFQERFSKFPVTDDANETNDSDTETIYAVDGRSDEATNRSLATVSSQDESKRSLISLPSLHSTRSRIVPSLATGTPILRTREDLIRQLTWEIIWPVVAHCIRPLLFALKTEKVHSMYETPAPDIYNQMPGGMVTSISAIVTSRVTRPTGGPISYGSTQRTPILQSAAAAGSSDPADAQRMLGSLLLISSKQINNRKHESVDLPPSQFQPVQPLAQLPATAPAPAPQCQSLVSQGSRATTSQQQRPASGMRIPSASARGRLGRGRLHPMDRPKTPSAAQQDDYIFDGLRGQKLHTAAELRPQQSSFIGGVPLPKNSPLPPLHHSYAGIGSALVGSGIPAMTSTAQSAGEFLSVAPVSGNAVYRGTVQRNFAVPANTRSPSAAVIHERPLPTFRVVSDAFSGSNVTSSGRPVGGASSQPNSNSLYVLNRSGTLLNVTGVGVAGGGVNQSDDYDRMVHHSSSVSARAPATAIGMARASLVPSSQAPSHGVQGR